MPQNTTASCHGNQFSGLMEPLEPKLAPAGTVLVSYTGGILTITGDAVNNGIAITDNPAAGVWTISDPTASMTSFVVNGGAPTVGPVNIPAQNSIKADLKDGEDRFDLISATSPAGLLLPGGFSLIMGKGNDTVNLTNAAAQQITISGVGSVDLGEGNDTLNITGQLLATNTFKFLGGAGNDSIFFGASSSVQFLKGLTIDLGAGADTFTTVGDLFEVTGGAFSIKGAGILGGIQTVNLTPDVGHYDSAATIAFTAGKLDVDIGIIGSDISRFSAGLTITAGKEDDIVKFNGTTSVAGALTIDLKDGANTINLQASRTLHAGSLVIKGGTGADTLALVDNSVLTVAGLFSLSQGAGTNTWNAQGGSVFSAGTLTVLGGAGADTFDFDGATLSVLGAATINGGAGTNQFLIGPTASGFFGGNLTLTGAAGDDSVSLNSPSLRILGNLACALGDGVNFSVAAGALLNVLGGLSYTGGSGIDTFDSTNTSFVVGKTLSFATGAGATNYLYLAPTTGTVGAFTFTGGTGYDQLGLGNTDGTSTTRLAINGAVSVNFGTGLVYAVITDTVIHGALTIGMTGTSAHTDQVTFNQVTINGAVNITHNAGASLLSVENSLFRSAFTSNLGAGADIVGLDASAGAGLSTWLGAVKINGGAGEDSFTVGSNPVVANAGNNFFKNVVIDGGADNDSYVGGNNTLATGVSLTQINIP